MTARRARAQEMSRGRTGCPARRPFLAGPRRGRRRGRRRGSSPWRPPRRRAPAGPCPRRTYRSEGKVKNETVATLSALPDHVIDWIDAGLKGRQLVPAGEAVTITRSLPHGHVAAVHAMAVKLGVPALLGPAGRARDL